MILCTKTTVADKNGYISMHTNTEDDVMAVNNLGTYTASETHKQPYVAFVSHRTHTLEAHIVN